MNNLISFHLLLFVLTKVYCGIFSTKVNVVKSKFKLWLSLYIGILLLILISIILILIYVFHNRQRINNQNSKVKRQLKEYDIPNVSYNNHIINELDTIQTVGTPSELNDHYLETEVKTII